MKREIAEEGGKIGMGLQQAILKEENGKNSQLVICDLAEGEEWKTNHIGGLGLWWYGGRETCQELTDQVGGLANSMEWGGLCYPPPPPPPVSCCARTCLYRCLGFLLDPNCYKLCWVVPLLSSLLFLSRPPLEAFYLFSSNYFQTIISKNIFK